MQKHNMGDSQKIINIDMTSMPPIEEKIECAAGDNIASNNSKFLMEYQDLSQQIHGQNLIVDELKNKLRFENADDKNKTSADDDVGSQRTVRKAASTTATMATLKDSYMEKTTGNARSHASMTNVGKSLVVDLIPTSGESNDDYDYESETFSYEEDDAKDYGDNNNLNTEMNECQQVLLENDNTIDGLDEKYVVLNFELNSMERTHEHFLSHEEGEEYYTDTNNSTTDSEYSLNRKYTQIFNPNSIGDGDQEKNSPNTKENNPNGADDHDSSEQMPGSLWRQRSSMKTPRMDNKENIPPPGAITKQRSSLNLKNIIQILKNLFDIHIDETSSSDYIRQQSSSNLPNNLESDLKELHAVISALQLEQEEFRKVIQEQQRNLNDYHCKYVKAQKLIQQQKFDISKLHASNTKLENEINTSMDSLKAKFETKLQEVGHLPKMIKAEKSKNEKYSKDNSALMGRVRTLQSEIGLLRQKLEEAIRRKAATVSRFKATEKDLKIFKNQNNILKQEKTKLAEELIKLRACLETMQLTKNKNVARQRERIETEKRSLQKRINDLEAELSESRASTSNLLMDRDRMIAEMQTQLNTLVHNFEVSQKYVRVLRRHIYSAGSSSCSNLNLAEKLQR